MSEHALTISKILSQYEKGLLTAYEMLEEINLVTYKAIIDKKKESQ